MKKQIRYLFILALTVILAIVSYQSYWLNDIYKTLQDDLNRDIQEAMRAADFEEIVHRVELLKEEQNGGHMAVRVGVNDSHDKAVVANNYEKPDTHELPQETPEEVDNRLEFDEFANVLRTQDDVMNVGLEMQRGIHMGLDALKSLDEAYYDSVLQQRLKSLAVMGHCITQRVRYEQSDLTSPTSVVLYSSEEVGTARVDTFRHIIDTEGREAYLLLREKSLYVLPRQMYSPILLSVLMLLVLITAFWYIIRMIKRIGQLDEMKTDFTNNITHEMKTPIAVAYAAGDALLNFDAGKDPEKSKKYLTICLQQLDQLKELVERILSLSTNRQMNVKLNVEPVDVNMIVAKVLANQKMKSEKVVTMHVDIPEGTTLVTDAFHFTNIMNNLVDNAMKYSGDDVSIDIHAHRASDGGLQIAVSDNGMGIEKSQQRFVFDKFYRVPHGNVHDIKGYGLGLNYVKLMMERFDGSVTVSSELSKGSTFTLHFPKKQMNA